ncbi:MAG: cell division protein FtsW [Eubacterium sp.]|nr:cell division protein FtsW [Eubacterium sp.]
MPFLAITIALLTIGLIMLFSASYPYAYARQNYNSYYFINRQLIFAAAGIVVMFIMSKINYKWLKVGALILVPITFILLAIVLIIPATVVSDTGEAFKRWIQIGPIQFQPSDVAKFTLILVFAIYINKFYSKMKTLLYGIAFPLIILGVFCIFIVLEHHLSCTILMFLLGAAMMYVGGTNRYLYAFGLAVLIIAVVLVVLNPEIIPSQYARERIISWTDKKFSPDDMRWQTNNSLYAIGSGGFTGVGLGNSKQKYLYVSEPQNDFIFSIVCEELGFLGAAAIIILFGLLVYRGIKIAQKATDRFGALLVIGVVSQIGIQVILNILVVTDTIPNTGIALPFFSYGGTAMLMLLFEVGVVLSVSRKASQKRV